MMAEPCSTCGGTSLHCLHCDGMGIEPRKLVRYGDCRCVLSHYCDGKCNPIYEAAPSHTTIKEK